MRYHLVVKGPLAQAVAATDARAMTVMSATQHTPSECWLVVAPLVVLATVAEEQDLTARVQRWYAITTSWKEGYGYVDGTLLYYSVVALKEAAQ